MIRRTIVLAVVTALSLPAVSPAQDALTKQGVIPSPALDVKTFRLRNLKPEDAARLLGPYVNSPGGGVFEAGGIGAITVRETPKVLATVDSLLRVHDRPRTVVSMRFQLIAALDSSFRDPAIATVDAELRKLFRFAGYELIGEATMLTEEMNDFATTLTTKPKLVNGSPVRESFQILGWMEGATGTGNDRTVRVTISLQDASGGKQAPDLLRTGLSMPAGQMVILGSARPTHTFGSRAALILVVQPEITSR